MWWKIALTFILVSALFGGVAAMHQVRPPILVTLLAYLGGLATAAIWTAL
jgi:hypothetical protein